MLARPYRRHRDYRVRMVRSNYHHRLDVLLFFQHYAVVAVPLGLRVGIVCLGRAIIVNVAQSDNVFTLHLAKVVDALTSHTDPGYIQLFTRRRMTGAAENVPRHNRKRHSR